MTQSLEEIKSCIRETEGSPEFAKSLERAKKLVVERTEIVPDFPKAGVNFVNFIPMLAKSPDVLAAITECLSMRFRCAAISAVAGIDARGFIFGAPLAYDLNVPFLAIRKAGKLPPPVDRADYHSEYAQSALEIEKELVSKGDNILFIDDILATGGTFLATRQLVENLEATIVEAVFIGELSALGARKKIEPTPIFCFHDFVE